MSLPVWGYPSAIRFAWACCRISARACAAFEPIPIAYPTMCALRKTLAASRRQRPPNQPQPTAHQPPPRKLGPRPRSALSLLYTLNIYTCRAYIKGKHREAAIQKYKELAAAKKNPCARHQPAGHQGQEQAKAKAKNKLPTCDWLEGFCRRHSLSLRNTTLDASRVSAASNQRPHAQKMARAVQGGIGGTL
jgi:hypothetical protein